ncbi:MAG: hypothetical protein MHM6MM_008828, partial [Cercozoa sp. M6MM]
MKVVAAVAVKGHPNRMLRVQTSIEHSDDITSYTLRALRRVATVSTETNYAISNALVYLLWCEAKLYDPLSGACDPDFIHCLEEFDMQFEFSLSPKLKLVLLPSDARDVLIVAELCLKAASTCWEFIEESPCPNKLATFVRTRVKYAMEMVRRKGGTLCLQEWLPCMLVKPSLCMESPDYSDLFNEMQVMFNIQDSRVDYTRMLERINARVHSKIVRNTSPFARLLMAHEVVQSFDFGSYVSGRCAHHLSLGGSLVDVMRMHTGVVNIQGVLTSVRSQPLSEWAHLLPFLEEGKGRIHAPLASLPEMAKSFISQCADASADDVDRAMQVLRMLRGSVELQPVKLWILGETCEFRYSSQLRRSLHGLAKVLGTIPSVLSSQGARLSVFPVQRLLFPRSCRREHVFMSSKALQEVHALLWMFVLSGVTGTKQRSQPDTLENAQCVLVQSLLLQLAQQVTTRLLKDTHTLLLNMCDDAFGEGAVPVEVVNLVHSFV